MPPSANSTQNTPLPPSVEKAYYRKCIEIKRRIIEVEESNDAARLRKVRLHRAITKMRLERAFLLEKLADRMDYNPDASDKSTSAPPTPQDKPVRAKRPQRKEDDPSMQSPPPHPHALPSSHMTAYPDAHSTPDHHGRQIYHHVAAVNGNVPPHADPPPYPHQQPMLPHQPGYAPYQGPGSANGGGEYQRPFGGGSTGEAVGAGPEIRLDANGERRVQPETEPGDGGAGFSGGFTAVNR
ncbi:hypothetical protein LTR16_001619 [Cryomyces antarcticus]|uniref:INO80 complex subunit F domain-containing protein n=1 Tax=Cryomyces antarcticus TaxID=329879 RepID=A0ABR0LZ62_9PEZI|nr:hypothetical protein LTR60_001210 [Cryomyces antarcticus]KAK5257102.1 hypothetical protein LTR16_001619 [Cryomyces antarcticus]